MGRTIAYLVVTCTVLAGLAFLVQFAPERPFFESGPESAARELQVAPAASRAPTGQASATETVELLNRPTADAVPVEVPQPPLRTEPNILAVIEGEPFPQVESPPWSDAMEATILAYVARHSGLVLTDLQVQCADSGCVIFMGGPNIPVYQMNFDVFAEEHGFGTATIRGSDGSDRRIVFLRR